MDQSPTIPPTDVPTDVPADVPTDTPADVPTAVPADVPTDVPTDVPADVPDDDFKEQAPKFAITKSLEKMKYAFFENRFDDVKTQLKSGDFRAFFGSYKSNDDFDGRPRFVVNNFVCGQVQMLDDKRKYVFSRFVCARNGDCNHNFRVAFITNLTDPIENALPEITDSYDIIEYKLPDEIDIVMGDFQVDENEFVASKYTH